MDISRIPAKMQCPNCSFEIDLFLKQFVTEELLLCPGCLKEIQLVDENGSVSRAQVEINEAFEDFARQLAKR